MELMMTLLASALILLTLSKSTSSFAGYSNLPYNLPRLSVAHQTSRLEIPDIERARDCAENFGVCSLDEIEEIKKALHNDRLMHMAENMASYRSDLNPEDEIDLLLLEQELTMQSNLLKEAILEAGESIRRPPQAMDIAITVHNSKPIQVEETDNQESIVGSQVIYATKQEVYNSYLSY